MKKLVTMCMVVALAAVSTKALAAPPADTLAEVKKKGVLVAGVKDSLPPFGYIDEKTRTIVGYDIDFVNAIAKKLGVKVEMKPVTSASRMPQLQEGNIDLIAATMTKERRARQSNRFQPHLFLHRPEVHCPKRQGKDAQRPGRQENRHHQGFHLRAERKDRDTDIHRTFL